MYIQNVCMHTKIIDIHTELKTKSDLTAKSCNPDKNIKGSNGTLGILLCILFGCKDDNTTNKSSLVNSLFCATIEIVIWFIVLHFL